MTGARDRNGTVDEHGSVVGDVHGDQVGHSTGAGIHLSMIYIYYMSIILSYNGNYLKWSTNLVTSSY